MNKKYESVIVFSTDLEEEGTKAQIEKINGIVQAHGGSITRSDIWGRRQLAYPIKRKEYGIFVVLVFDGSNTLVADLRRQLRINESVIRFLIVKKDKFAPDFVRRRDDDQRADGISIASPEEDIPGAEEQSF